VTPFPDEYEASRLLQHAAEFVDLNLEERNVLRKNDERKELVSWLLSRKTAVTQAWIAQQLGMGNRVNVSRAIQRIERANDALMQKRKADLEEMYRCVH
jgi:hypothetical protein